MSYENANIETIARGVCIRDGHILLCKPAKGGRAYLPGGHIEFNETGRQALVREVKEELGLDSTAGDFLAVTENTFIQGGERHCEINLIFRLDVPTLPPPPAALPATEPWIAFAWVPFDAPSLKAANLLPAHLIDDLPTYLATPGQHTAER